MASAPEPPAPEAAAPEPPGAAPSGFGGLSGPNAGSTDPWAAPSADPAAPAASGGDDAFLDEIRKAMDETPAAAADAPPEEPQPRQSRWRRKG